MQTNDDVTVRDNVLSYFAKVRALIHVFSLAEKHWDEIPQEIISDYFWGIDKFMTSAEKER